MDRALKLGALLALLAGCSPASASDLCEGAGSCEVDGVAGQCVEGFCAIPTDECPSGEWVEGPNQGSCVGQSEADGGDGDTLGTESETHAGESEESESESESEGAELDMGEPPCEVPSEIDGRTLQLLDTIEAADGPIEFLAADESEPHPNPHFMVATGSEVALYRILDGNTVSNVPISTGTPGPYLDINAAVFAEQDEPTFVYVTEDAAFVRRLSDGWDESMVMPQAGSPIAATLHRVSSALFLGTDVPAVNVFDLSTDAPLFLVSEEGFAPIVYMENAQYFGNDIIGVGQALSDRRYFGPLTNGTEFPAEIDPVVYERQYVDFFSSASSSVTAWYQSDEGTLEAQFEFLEHPEPVEELPFAVESAAAIGKLNSPNTEAPVFALIANSDEGARIISVVDDGEPPAATDHGLLCAKGRVTALTTMQSATRGYLVLGTDEGFISVYSLL